MRGARIAGIVLIAAVAGFVAAQWLWPREEPALPTSPAPAAVPAPAAPETPLVSPRGELRIASSGSIAIEAAALEPGRPVVLLLDIGVPSRSDEPLAVRIASVDDGRLLDGRAVVAGERKEARFEIDPSFLSRPGSYLVEVKTNEQTALPLRRYVIVVR